jgi:TolB-like protein
MATVQRRLSVIVRADVLDYRRLMGSDELGTLTALKAHREAIDPLFAKEGGRLVKVTSDGLLLEFPSAFRAMRAASSVQRLMAERNAAVPADKRLVFRMGVHRGDVIVDHSDISGDGVDIAAQLRENAEPGGIRASQAIHTALDVPEDVPLKSAATASAGLLSFIVVPFVNSTGDAQHDYFIDGITDHLTNELARIENSRPVPHAIAMAYRRDALDVPEIGRKLGGRFAIVGRVRAEKEALDINIELLETANAQCLWSDRFDIALADPFAMENAVVLRVMPPLRTQLLIAREHSLLIEPVSISPTQNATIPAEPAVSSDSIPVERRPAPAEAMPAGSSASPPATLSEPVLVASEQDYVAAVVAVTPIFVAPTRDAAVAFENPLSTPPVVSRPTPKVAFRPAPGRPLPAPAPNASPTRHVPFWLGPRIKLAIILAVGVVALAVLGAERRSIVEIVSCMLVAAGIVQLIAIIANGQRT